MSNVTVTGAHGATVTIPISSGQNAEIASQLLAGISAAEAPGTITPYSGSGFGSLTPPPGESVLFLATPGLVAIPGSTGTVVDTATSPTLLFGGNSASQVVISGNGGIDYFANTGAGTVVA